MLEEPTDALMFQQSPPPPTNTEFVHNDEEIVGIRCEGYADASTSHQPPPTVSMPPHPISHTPQDDAEITLEEEDAEVSPELEETGDDASSGEPSPKEVVTKPDAQSVSPGDPPLSNE